MIRNDFSFSAPAHLFLETYLNKISQAICNAADSNIFFDLSFTYFLLLQHNRSN